METYFEYSKDKQIQDLLEEKERIEEAWLKAESVQKLIEKRIQQIKNKDE